jgi:hypothetical protein
MKKIFSVIAVAIYLVTGLTGCIKNDPVVFKEQQVEFDATSWNANSAGLTYPILGRIPGYGRVANTTDSTLRRFPQTIRIRVNLIGGGQLSKAETVGFETFVSPITSFSMPATITGQTPAAAAATLTVSDAAAGTHYAPLSGTLSFPAGSSFTFLDITILNPGPTAGTGRFLGVRLNNNGTLKRAVNYSELGLVIDQR